eukprot:TRINITY_DN11633_c0_g1_i2.p2 TRINITY_DN11633_c0_g1~~TRINITY_DN11633_c0_g1_i2.p2  ORF type:complete len:106 (-),score=37.72 TRINITY_DN11633_c0_g1_i2:24-341(-)
MTVCLLARGQEGMEWKDDLDQEDAPVEMCQRAYYQLFSPLATSSCPVMLNITTFSYTSCSKTRLTLVLPKQVKKEALVKMILGQDQDTHDRLEGKAKQITSVSYR